MEKSIDNNEEVCYTYDEKGNLLSKTTNGERVEYTYEESAGRLLKYGEESFAYDEIGNPTTFRDMTAVWTKGRKKFTQKAMAVMDSIGDAFDKIGAYLIKE